MKANLSCFFIVYLHDRLNPFVWVHRQKAILATQLLFATTQKHNIALTKYLVSVFVGVVDVLIFFILNFLIIKIR